MFCPGVPVVERPYADGRGLGRLLQRGREEETGCWCSGEELPSTQFDPGASANVCLACHRSSLFRRRSVALVAFVARLAHSERARSSRRAKRLEIALSATRHCIASFTPGGLRTRPRTDAGATATGCARQAGRRFATRNISRSPG
jgi:hypothetical protein